LGLGGASVADKWDYVKVVVLHAKEKVVWFCETSLKSYGSSDAMDKIFVVCEINSLSYATDGSHLGYH
jgi:hypothetical protein